jgi:hypothetical protein
MGGSFDEARWDPERYLGWFAWAQSTLARDLEGSHAAAEAAYEAESEGATRAVAEVAGRGAAGEHLALDASSIATAEWAYWAQKRFGISSTDGLNAARQGMAVLDSSHNLDTAIAAVETVMASRRSPTQPVSAPLIPPAPAPPVSRPFWRRTWVLVVGAMAVTAIFTAAITAGLMSSSSSNAPLGKPSTPPAMAVTVTADGNANIALTGFPPDTNIYILVDNVVQVNVRTDSAGSAQTAIPLDLGGHQLAACLDFQGASCPATDFETRSR